MLGKLVIQPYWDLPNDQERARQRVTDCVAKFQFLLITLILDKARGNIWYQNGPNDVPTIPADTYIYETETVENTETVKNTGTVNTAGSGSKSGSASGSSSVGAQLPDAPLALPLVPVLLKNLVMEGMNLMVMELKQAETKRMKITIPLVIPATWSQGRKRMKHLTLMRKRRMRRLFLLFTWLRLTQIRLFPT
jgi:hypothetical protein